MTPMEIFVYAAPALVLILALTYSRYAGKRLDRMQAELDRRATGLDVVEEDDVLVSKVVKSANTAERPTANRGRAVNERA